MIINNFVIASLYKFIIFHLIIKTKSTIINNLNVARPGVLVRSLQHTLLGKGESIAGAKPCGRFKKQEK